MDLTGSGAESRKAQEPSDMSNAIHQFRLAQLNSEIKYVLHSISHEPPPHAYPAIPDIYQWQQGIIERLQQWSRQIPQYDAGQEHVIKLAEVKYHGIMMLLLRPSPRLPNPSQDSLKLCYHSAVKSIRLYHELYISDRLAYSWITVHSMFLSIITLLYCIWIVPDIANETKVDTLMADLKAGSNVLSATGEHWPEARRSRDVLDELSSATIRWVMEGGSRKAAGASRSAVSRGKHQHGWGTVQASRPQLLPLIPSGGLSDEDHTFIHDSDTNQVSYPDLTSMDSFIDTELLSTLIGGSEQNDPFGLTMPMDVDTIIAGLFSDFQPTLELGHNGFVGGQMW